MTPSDIVAHIMKTYRSRRNLSLHRRIVRLLAAHRLEGPASYFTPAGGRDAGHIGYDMGRLDVTVADGTIETRWTGNGSHAVPSRVHVTSDIDSFLSNLHKMTRRHFVSERRPDAGPHHMLI